MQQSETPYSGNATVTRGIKKADALEVYALQVASVPGQYPYVGAHMAQLRRLVREASRLAEFGRPVNEAALFREYIALVLYKAKSVRSLICGPPTHPKCHMQVSLQQVSAAVMSCRPNVTRPCPSSVLSGSSNMFDRGVGIAECDAVGYVDA